MANITIKEIDDSAYVEERASEIREKNEIFFLIDPYIEWADTMTLSEYEQVVGMGGFDDIDSLIDEINLKTGKELFIEGLDMKEEIIKKVIEISENRGIPLFKLLQAYAFRGKTYLHMKRYLRKKLGSLSGYELELYQGGRFTRYELEKGLYYLYLGSLFFKPSES